MRFIDSFIPEFADERYTAVPIDPDNGFDIYHTIDGSHEIIMYGSTSHGDYADAAITGYLAADIAYAWAVCVGTCNVCSMKVCGKLDEKNDAIEHALFGECSNCPDCEHN